MTISSAFDKNLARRDNMCHINNRFTYVTALFYALEMIE